MVSTVQRRRRRDGASLFATREQWFAHTERLLNALPGVTPIAQLTARTRATVAGVVRSVTLRPGAHVQAYEIDLYDGSGTLHVIWLGRRRVLGVEPGRRMIASGLARIDTTGERSMYNPSYRILARAGE